MTESKNEDPKINGIVSVKPSSPLHAMLNTRADELEKEVKKIREFCSVSKFLDSNLNAMLNTHADELELGSKALRNFNVDHFLDCAEQAQKSVERLLAFMPIQDAARAIPFNAIWMGKLGDTKGWVNQMYETLRQLKS